MRKVIERTTCDFCGLTRDGTVEGWGQGETKLPGIAAIRHDMCPPCLQGLPQAKFDVLFGPKVQDRLKRTPRGTTPLNWVKVDDCTYERDGWKIIKDAERSWRGIMPSGVDRKFGPNKAEAFRWMDRQYDKVQPMASAHPATAEEPSEKKDRYALLKAAKERLSQKGKLGDIQFFQE